jgi:hypothetical protein
LLYFTDACTRGPVHCSQLPDRIGVLEAAENTRPIGIASEIGRTHAGLAVWSLRVHGADVPGRWVIVDGRFLAIEDAPG